MLFRSRHANAVAAFDRQRKEFETYYLDLNVPYWRVQNYAPAFTMMTWLVRDEPLVAGIYDWRRMRNSLRDFLNYPIRTRSLFQYGWAWMKCLEAWFGERVWKHYGECRLPIGPGEPALLQDDLDFYHYDLAAAKLDGLAAMLGLIERIEKENPRSYMRQLAMYAALGRAISDGKSDTADDLVRKLGIVTEANVVGPLGENNGFASPVSPEWHTDLSEEFRFSGTVSRWKAQECDLAGFFLRRSDYRGDWSGYALSYIYCPQETQAVLWVRAKNQYGAWLNNAMVEKEPIYNQFVWDIYSDFAFHHITFKKGWNKLLGRFHFNQGDGMIRMRITDRNGNAIEGLQITADDHEKEIPPIPQAVKGSAIFTDTFDNSLSTKNWGTPAGSFKVKSGMLYSQNGGATKFRFVAVPDEKKDPDPAIMWLKNQTVTRLESYAIEFEVKALDPRIPVMYITLEGSGKEIITSGISIHLSEKWGTLNWQLAHYDTIYCTGSVKKFPHAQSYIFKIEKARDFYSLAINDTVLFQSVSLPPVKRGMIGLAFTEKALADRKSVV